MNIGKHLYRIFALIIVAAACSCSNENKPENLGIFSPGRLKAAAGQDGCNPITLTHNTVMWTFGDTILGSWGKPPSLGSTFEASAVMDRMISNSLAFTTVPAPENAASLKFTYYTEKGMPAPFLKHRSDENPSTVRLWPLDGIRVKSTVYIYYLKVLTGKNRGPDLFRVKGTEIALWKIPERWRVGDSVRFRRTKRLFSSGMPCMGDSVIMKDGYLYITGHGKTGKGSGVSAYIARVRPKHILNAGAYCFLREDGKWSGSIRGNSGFFHDVMGELSLSYHERTGTYMIVYCGSDGAVSLVRFRSFRNINLAEPVDVYRPPPLPEIHDRNFYFYYSAKEIFHNNRNIYAVYMNPAVYQPVLVRIPVAAAGVKD